VMVLMLSHPLKAMQKLNKFTKPGGDVGFGLRKVIQQ